MYHIKTCLDCSDRTVGCHMNCERYIEAKKEHDRLRQSIKEDHELDQYKSDKRFARKLKMYKKYGKAY